MILEKDLYTGKYIIWEKHRNYMVEIFRGFKIQCEEWLNAKKRNIGSSR